MWSLLVQPFSKLWSKLLLLAIPWLRRWLFGRVVKTAGKGALKKAPLGFHAPNLIVTGISICVINGINLLVSLLYSDGIMISLISAGSVTAVTAFFLLRGVFCPHTKRERIVLLSVLIVFFLLFLVFLLIVEVPWLAFVFKLTLEVIFCSAVMLVELNRLNRAQSRAVDAAMKALKVSRDGRIGKLFMRFGAPRESAPPREDEIGEDTGTT